jgi:hypothetical protein
LFVPLIFATVQSMQRPAGHTLLAGHLWANFGHSSVSGIYAVGVKGD